jgi:hypothetical protein
VRIYFTAFRFERSSNLETSFSTSEITSEEDPLARARITKREFFGSFESCGAAAWRSLRASAWRATEPPTPLLTINPNFGGLVTSGAGLM